MYDIWQRLSRVALMGMERASLDGECLRQMAAEGLPTNLEPSKQLMEAAAFYGFMRKAGNAPKKLDTALRLAADGAGNIPCCPAVAEQLRKIIDGHYADALPELLTHLRRKGLALPPYILPELFDRCLEDAELWSQVQDMIGKRGTWLLAQHPAWRHLAETPDSGAWEMGKKNERVRFLEQLRRRSPAKAIALLQASWQQETSQQKAAFLAALHTGLSLDDEPFLEACLGDTNKGVKMEAMLLLGALPASRFVQEATERASRLVSLGANGQLHFKIEGNDLLLTFVPPAFWESHLGLSPEQIARIVWEDEKQWPAIDMLFGAASRFRDLRWANALLDHWAHTEQDPRWAKIGKSALFGLVDVATFHRAAIYVLSQQKEMLPENAPLLQLLKGSPHPWSCELAQAFLEHLQKWMWGEPSRYWEGWHLKDTLKRAAYATPPACTERLLENWSMPENSPVTTAWRNDMEHFWGVLRFRHEMLACI
jgi:hypothetical protein